MRISDWSSDVCSSDLIRLRYWPWWQKKFTRSNVSRVCMNLPNPICARCAWQTSACITEMVCLDCRKWRHLTALFWRPPDWKCPIPCRSEEHTSELQSLMRISYAVFCLKKKNRNNEKESKQHLKASYNNCCDQIREKR